MRLNKYIAQSTGLSRRAADAAITGGRVTVNGVPAELGTDVTDTDSVTLDSHAITPAVNTITIMLNKPRGFVCSRRGQGSRTVYDLLPADYQQLKPAGRLDKDSSGLLIMTNNGNLAQQLTHPKYQKTKIYTVMLDKPLEQDHEQLLQAPGVQLEDGISRLGLTKLGATRREWRITMHEGRNRQIRRSFGALGYNVVLLHRDVLGAYKLSDHRLSAGSWTEL